MDNKLPEHFSLSQEVVYALRFDLPIVALESTVITHGLPFPENLDLSRDIEKELREQGATPATIAVIDGKIRIGLVDEQVQQLARGEKIHKISSRDLAPAVIKGWTGGTTVAGTMAAARKAGIKVFATGGIGGVHRQINAGKVTRAMDISADLIELSRTAMIVVCAGAKSILDLPATIEYLETIGVPVVGYQTDEFPAFYSNKSGLKTSVRAESPAEVAEIAKAHWSLDLHSAILVGNPLSEVEAVRGSEIESAVEKALQEADSQGVRGQDVTPFLLNRVSELTTGASLKANLALLKNNARLAALIAKQLSKGRYVQV